MREEARRRRPDGSLDRRVHLRPMRRWSRQRKRFRTRSRALASLLLLRVRLFHSPALKSDNKEQESSELIITNKWPACELFTSSFGFSVSIPAGLTAVKPFMFQEMQQETSRFRVGEGGCLWNDRPNQNAGPGRRRRRGLRGLPCQPQEGQS